MQAPLVFARGNSRLNDRDSSLAATRLVERLPRSSEIARPR